MVYNFYLIYYLEYIQVLGFHNRAIFSGLRISLCLASKTRQYFLPFKVLFPFPPTKVSSLTNDSGYQTAAQVTSAINAKLVVMTDTELNTMWTEVFGA